MKRILFSCLVFVALTITVYSQEIDKMPSVTVTGTSEILIAPDEAVFSLDVTKRDKDLQIAKRQSDDAISKMLDLAKRFGVEPKNVKTDYISVAMKYTSIRDPKNRIYDEDGDEIGKRVFQGYEVSTTITVRLTDIKRVEEFFGEALKTGITEVNSVKFETSTPRVHRDTARDMAMKAAKEKAAALAGSIGQTIGKAIKISEVSGNPTYGYAANISANSNSAITTGSFTTDVTTFSPGAIKVEAQVSVTFLLN
ncbi:MAG TPA: SIMPL domain-containing protein [Pyrinomonadaceae bacterium]|jgi:uncharacterized protein YggE|nr:SIMPL domain-containing protein [Pyrinomonadaceae bacterium]